MPNPTIYLPEKQFEWMEQKRGGTSRASFIQHALAYYKHHQDEVDDWENPGEAEESICGYCGQEFANRRGVAVHQTTCEDNPNNEKRTPEATS